MEKHRITTWWIRWEDLNWPAPDNWDKIKARAEAFASANVSAALIFGAHFRWDFLPMFPLLHDYMAAVAEELHKYNIKLFDHHSVNLVHRYRTREEMRRVMRDSGPHLPFCPTWDAAANWEYNGKRLNDWRMIDVKTGTPMYFPQYTGEGFCHRNPEFIDAYKAYLKQLIADTNIDGLSADDAMHYGGFNTCGCAHCRAELRRRSGIDLPPIEDQSFWGNWDNPAWNHWMDLRFDSTGEFYKAVAEVLPEDFMLTGCGSDSASCVAVHNATDARQFLQGCNYVNLEMNGNTPPYKQDPLTVNKSISQRLTNGSHHQATAREKGARAFNTGFAHVTQTANIAWAVSKILDADAWIMALKPRLGLPQHILDTLPNEEDIVGNAFGFEKAHPDLFRGSFVGQLGVYFSAETRNHTLFGAMEYGYSNDYSRTLTDLMRIGICPHTVFDFPEKPDIYPAVLLPSAYILTEREQSAMAAYLAAGGKVIATGPCAAAGCKHSWKLPNRVSCSPRDFFPTYPDGIRPKRADWVNDRSLPHCTDPDQWQKPTENLYYHPYRASDGRNTEETLRLAREFARQMPVRILEATGYLCTMFEAEDQVTVHFLAEDYDTDIDHKLDAMRYHRSRVNFINKVTPIGITGLLKIQTEKQPEVYLPFHTEPATVSAENGICTVTLPENCAYAILRFAK